MKKPPPHTLPPPPPKCLLAHPGESNAGTAPLSDLVKSVSYTYHAPSRTLELRLPSLARWVEMVRFLRFSSGHITSTTIVLRP